MSEEEKVQAEEKPKAEPSEFVAHLKEAGKSTGRMWGSLIPPAFWEYRRKARREMLLAFRSAVDAAIDRLEGKSTDAPKPAPKPKPRRKVRIEVKTEGKE